MAVQTYVKKGNDYNAALSLDNDPDSNEVFVSLSHEWGDPIFAHSRLSFGAVGGDTELSVVDGTVFAVNDQIIILGGRPESVVIYAIDGNTLTTDPLDFAHNSGVQVSVEKLATRDSAGEYSYEFDETDLASGGQHKIKWHYFVSGTSVIKDVFVTVYQQYIDKATFFDAYPELEDEFDDFFDATERKVRKIIEGHCGQSFDLFPAKTLIFEGSGRNTLHLITRLEDFTTVTLKDDYSDITNLVEFDPYSKFYLKLTGSTAAPLPASKSLSTSKANWGAGSDFEILGDWGWAHVPENITQAAAILVADQFNDDSQYTKHGVIDASMDTHRMKWDSVILGTTGNQDADVLLMDYTMFIIGQI